MEDFLSCSLTKSDFEEAYGLLCVEDVENVDDEPRDTGEIPWNADNFFAMVKQAQEHYLESEENRERELVVKIKDLPSNVTVVLLYNLLRVLKDYQCICSPTRCVTRFVVAENERQRMKLVMRATQPANDQCSVTPLQWITFIETIQKQTETDWR
jgi:hypothetical protein